MIIMILANYNINNIIQCILSILILTLTRTLSIRAMDPGRGAPLFERLLPDVNSER